MVTKVRGTFNDFEGTAVLDGDNPANSTRQGDHQGPQHRHPQRPARRPPAQQRLPLDGRVPGDHLRLDRRSRSCDDDIFELTGDLTVKGVTKSVTIPFEYQGAAQDPFGNSRVGFEGSVTINRKDFGVNFNAALETGGVLVSDKITLEFDISAIKNA